MFRLASASLASLIVLSSPAVIAAPTPDAAPKAVAAQRPDEGWIWENVPYAPIVLDHFRHLTHDVLRQIVFAALPQLAIDDETVEAGVAEDIALLFRAAVALQMLEAHGMLDQELRIVSRTLAFYLERVGRAYDTNPVVRDTFARLPSLVPPESRQVAATLGPSLAGARAYASRWFERAIMAEGPESTWSATAFNQRGIIAHGAGRLNDAAVAFGKALARGASLQAVINTYALLRDMDTPDALAEADKLKKATLDKTPLVADRFDVVDRKIADTKAIERFRTARPEMDAAAMVAMSRTLLARDGADEAEALAREALGRFRDNPIVWHNAASVLQASGRKDSLKVLYADAIASGHLDERLRESRITSLVDARISAGFGAVAPLRDDALLASELTWLEGLGRHQSFIAAVARFVIELADHTVLRSGDDAAATKASATRVKAGALSLAKQFKEIPDAWRVAIAGHAAAGAFAAGDTSILRKTPAAKDPGMALVRAVAARLEAAYAMRASDPKRMTVAEKSLRAADKDLERLSKSATADVAAKLAEDRALTQMMLGQIAAMRVRLPAGGAAALGDADKRRWQEASVMIAAAMTSFDEAFQAGRSRLQAGHASRAAIVLGLGDVSTAETALRAARRLDESGYLASIAASRLLADRDLFEAAVDYVGRALGDDPGVHGEQYAHLRAAELHGKLGGTALATEAAKLALDKWDDADVPDTIPEGALRAVIVSELGVSIAVDGDKPLSLILAIEPLVALLPEHAASRESVTKIKETAPTPATPPTP